MTVLNYVENCACDSCSAVGLCLPVADGVYCTDCYQAAQDAITDEMDEAFDEDPRDYYQEMIDREADFPELDDLMFADERDFDMRDEF